MKVMILSAGQGKRLLPLTADLPKALLDIGGQTLILRQIEALAACGLREFVVVTGYGAEAMDRALADAAGRHGLSVSAVLNPFYAVADNLASCWMARHAMDGPFLQVNGDNIFRAELVQALLDAPAAEINVAISRKRLYDADDMKVMLDGTRLTEIGKTLPVEAVDAEAIGFYVFNAKGARRYRQALDDDIRKQANLRQWFPATIARLAKSAHIGVTDVSAHEWCEVDSPLDLQRARRLVANW